MWAQVFKRLILPLLLHLCLPSSFFSVCFPSNQNTSGSSPTSYAVHRFFASNKVLHTWSWPLISIHTDAKERRYTHQSQSHPSAFTLASPVCPAFLHLWILAVTPFTCHKQFNWLTLAREGWKEYNSRQTGGSVKRFHHHHLWYVFVWPPYNTTFVPLGCGLQTVSYRISGFHEQFSEVLQAYVVYNKSNKHNFDNL